MLVARRLRPWITVYSAFLDRCKHGAEVTIGGSIVDVNLISFDQSTACFLRLDDGVGIADVFLPDKVYEAYSQYITESAVILVGGRVMQLDVPHEQKRQQRRVIGHTVKQMPTMHLVKE